MNNVHEQDGSGPAALDTLVFVAQRANTAAGDGKHAGSGGWATLWIYRLAGPLYEFKS